MRFQAIPSQVQNDAQPSCQENPDNPQMHILW